MDYSVICVIHHRDAESTEHYFWLLLDYWKIHWVYSGTIITCCILSDQLMNLDA